jgi:phenylpropionate dioxygenase-like ring-hydroxylating dioxygenase large terminal subunit
VTQVEKRTPRLEGLPEDPSIPYRPLDPKRFTSPEFLQQEKEKLWPRVWQMVCREDDVPNPGDFYEYEIFDQSVIVTRQINGSLKAFFNSCRHRGATLVEGCGHVDEFRCPYHAWTYGLDGRLKNMINPDEFPVEADYCLGECACDTWGGFVFINLDGQAGPLLEYLDPIPQMLAPYHFDKMTVSKQRTFVMPCNWKTAAEAFIEGWHTNGVHPQLLISLDDVNSTCDIHGRHSRMRNPMMVPSPRVGEVDEEVIFESFIEQLQEIGYETLDGLTLPEGMKVADFVAQMTVAFAGATGLDISDLTEDHIRQANCWLLFPNFQLQCTATETLVWRARPNGDDPDSCLFDQYMVHVVPEDAPRTPAEREHYADWHDAPKLGTILTQDFENLHKVQRGMHQRSCDGLLLGKDSELRIIHLHDEIDRTMGLE